MKRLPTIAKRGLDVTASVLGLVVLAFPFSVAALAIKLDSKGPVFFRQERAGKDGKPFRVWKFRTMVVGAIRQGLGVTVARGDTRITRVGRSLRNLGLDELPQLLNVLTGKMSLVGPRPTFLYHVRHYDSVQRKRLLMKPGITSLAVVSGRNALSWAERIELDVWYVEHWSFGLDLRILLATLWVVLITRRGVYAEDGANDPFAPPPEEEEDLDHGS
jgi:lipopolysaccharide/colanic/teichoic acid biosynthesis glycosyltransferase